MNEIDDDAITKRVRTMQIINFALVNGVVVCLAIMCYLVYGEGAGQGADERLPIVTLVAAGMLIPGTILSFLLPGIFVKRDLNRIAAGTWQPPPRANASEFQCDAIKLLAARQTGLIVGLALLEAPAFMACVAFLIESRIYALALVAIAVALMIVRFPTLGSTKAWLQEQLDTLNQLRR